MSDCKLFPLLEHAASNWPEDIAQVRGSHRLTFLQLKTAAEQLAAECLRADIKPGDKIGLMCPNGPEYVIGSFALFSIDAVVVPIFPGLKEQEIAALDAELRLDGICYSPELKCELPKKFTKHPLRLELNDAAITFCIEKHCGESFRHDSDKPLGGDAPLIRFTSGTTSKAKGVIIPQSAMIEYTLRFADVYAIQKGDCMLNILSMAHIFYQITAGMLRGAKLVVEDACNTTAIGRIIREEKVTHIEAAPSFYLMSLAAGHWSAADFRGVRYITSCGAPLADNVAAAFRKRFGREIVQRYGLTETGPVLINTSEDERKRGSLGMSARRCEVRLGANGAESLTDVGEIQVRCPGLFSGYYSPWTPRSAVLENGWFSTGDIARKDADGYYWMTGRTKTLINVGAVKVFPSELENILLSHAKVKEAHVYAAEDARFGEVPHAKVVLRPGLGGTQKELLQYVNGSLSVFKAVRQIEIVPHLAKTQTGKIKRYEPTKT